MKPLSGRSDLSQKGMEADNNGKLHCGALLVSGSATLTTDLAAAGGVAGWVAMVPAVQFWGMRLG